MIAAFANHMGQAVGKGKSVAPEYAALAAKPAEGRRFPIALCLSLFVAVLHKTPGQGV